MEYLVIDILIVALIYMIYHAGKSTATPRNPAQDFWEHKYDEFQKRITKDLENNKK